MDTLSFVMDYLERNYIAVLDFMTKCKEKFDNYAFPLKENYKFDIICLIKNKCFTTKVICTETKNPGDHYVANLLKSGGYSERKEVKKHFDNSECDYVYIWTPGNKYLIPSKSINQKKALTLSSVYDEFIIPS